MKLPFSKKEKIRKKDLITKMDSLIREHGNPESIQELYLYVSLYAPKLTSEENEFCKSYLRQRVARGLDRDYT
jgi:hypothetical protein